MSQNKSTPSPNARETSTTTAEEVHPGGGPYEVGVELEGVGPAAKVSRPRANRDTNRPLRSMCFMVEDCKWCLNPQGEDRGTLPEHVESPAVNALRENLEMMERDRLAVEARRAKTPTLVERYLTIRRKSA